MGSDWESGTLGDLVDFTPKRTIKKGVSAPFVSMADVPENSKVISGYNEREYKGGGSRFMNGDTIFARITPCLENGKTAKITALPDGAIAHGSTEFIVFGSKYPEYDTDYLYYLARWPEFRKFAETHMEGTSGRQRVSWQSLAKFETVFPPPKTRAKIGILLGSLDDKIELNRQMNQSLEAMAQALFKSWFADFDPVIDNALAAGNLIPEPLQNRAQIRQDLHKSGQVKALPEHIQKLFPSRFTLTDEMGWVPVGWEVKALDAIINLIGRGTPKTSIDEYWNGNIPWFSVVDAPNNSDVFVIDTEKHITELGVNKSSTKLLRKGTTIISARGTVGKCALVGTNMAMNQSCYGIVGANGIADIYTYFSIREFVSDLQQQGHGSVFNTITRETFKGITIPFSNAELTHCFDNTIMASLEYIRENLFQNRALSKLRDTLLPKLISGELRIPEAEEQVEEAVA